MKALWIMKKFDYNPFEKIRYKPIDCAWNKIFMKYNVIDCLYRDSEDHHMNVFMKLSMRNIHAMVFKHVCM